MDKDIFGFAEAIRIDDLSDEDFKIVELIFKDFEQIAACRLDKGDPPPQARGRACRYERVIKPLEFCEIYHTT